MRHRSRSRRTHRTLLATAVSLALVAAACGGDDGDGTPAPTEPSETTAAPDSDDGDASDGDTPAETTSTTVAPPPEADPESELAALCPVDALDGATAPVEIDMWHAMTVELEETLQLLVTEYNATQDRVRVRPIFQGSYTDTLDKYLTALRGGTRPTILQLEETALQIGVDSGAVIPVQACVDAAGYSFDDYIDRTITAYSVEGVLWPMPFNTSNPILYANMAALREAGIDELPTTLAEVRAASQAIVDAGVTPNGISLTSSSWIVEQLFGLADQLYVDNNNGRDARATEMLFDNELGLEIFTWLHDMVADGLATYVGSGDDAEHFLALALGQASMTMDTTAALRSVLEAAEAFPDVEVAVGPLPTVGTRDGGVLVGGAALWLDAETTDEERAAAWDFMTWLNEPEQQATWHAGTGYVPIRQSTIDLPEIVDLWETQPAFRLGYDQLVFGDETFATAGPVIGNHVQIRQRAVVPALEAMYLQGLPPDQALAQAVAQANDILADYNRRTGN